jgi:hypothetical protein
MGDARGDCMQRHDRVPVTTVVLVVVVVVVVIGMNLGLACYAMHMHMHAVTRLYSCGELSVPIID